MKYVAELIKRVNSGDVSNSFAINLLEKRFNSPIERAFSAA